MYPGAVEDEIHLEFYFFARFHIHTSLIPPVCCWAILNNMPSYRSPEPSAIVESRTEKGVAEVGTQHSKVEGGVKVSLAGLSVDKPRVQSRDIC